MEENNLSKSIELPSPALSDEVNKMAIRESIKNGVPADTALSAIAQAAFNNLKDASLPLSHKKEKGKSQEKATA